MSKRIARLAPPFAAVLGCLLLVAAHPSREAASIGVLSTTPELTSSPTPANNCQILVLWHTYRGSIDYERSQVRVRGAPFWSNLRSAGDGLGISSPPVQTVTNGRIYNWKEHLWGKRCDLWRRYRFKVVAPRYTGEPVRSNEPYAGAERWLYFPSNRSGDWTKTTSIDLGYLDWCVIDGARCSRPYYPSGPTPVLKW